MSLTPHNHRKLTITEQVAEVLRAGIQEDRWKNVIPGREILAREVGVSPMTIIRAFEILEQEGLITRQGPGRRRVILPVAKVPRAALRVTILTWDYKEHPPGYLVELKHRLIHAGYSAEVASKDLRDMKMDVQRVAKFVENSATDAWVIVAASREVVGWFSKQPVPAFALFGGILQQPIAGTGGDTGPAYLAAVHRLMDLGHQRIVVLRRPFNLGEELAVGLTRVFEEMEARGIKTGPYNYPQWEESPAGLRRCLDSLFAHTPPTALIIDTPLLYHAVKDHLASKGKIAPHDVSLICVGDDPTFLMCDPSVAIIHFEMSPCITNVLRWFSKLARGINDRAQRFVKGEFIDGGTVGPVPGRRQHGAG